MVQLSHLYLPTGKTIALTIRTFVGKVMSLLFNMLSRFVTAFLPRNSSVQFSSVHPLSHVWLFVTPWAAACQASLSITNSRSPPKLMSIESVMPSQPSHPLLSPSLPALNPSQDQGLFKWISSSHQVAKVLEFQLQHQTFQWTPRTDLL